MLKRKEKQKSFFKEALSLLLSIFFLLIVGFNEMIDIIAKVNFPDSQSALFLLKL